MDGDKSRISSRSASDRQRLKIGGLPGHWEGDLLSGSKNSYMATLVERPYPLRNVGEGGQQRQLIRQARKLPSEQYKSLTWDRGKELTDHRRFTLTTNIDVYFYDPQSPWQRGSDENTNGLLRQYFPKGTDLSVLASPLEQSGTSAQRTAT
jgi:IS30 family transposase